MAKARNVGCRGGKPARPFVSRRIVITMTWTMTEKMTSGVIAFTLD